MNDFGSTFAHDLCRRESNQNAMLGHARQTLAEPMSPGGLARLLSRVKIASSDLHGYIARNESEAVRIAMNAVGSMLGASAFSPHFSHEMSQLAPTIAPLASVTCRAGVTLAATAAKAGIQAGVHAFAEISERFSGSVSAIATDRLALALARRIQTDQHHMIHLVCEHKQDSVSANTPPSSSPVLG